MLKLVLGSLAALSLSFGAAPASATVNHGDFLGAGVDFKSVSETTQTAGDPEPIWEAPSLGGTGDQLLFFPSSFVSSCATGGSDVTESVLTTTIEAQPGVHIEIVALQEAGDSVMVASPPFGTPDTNTSAALTGTVTVVEDISGPIAPVVIPFSGSFVPSASFALPANFGTRAWTGSMAVDVASVVPNATKAVLSLTNTLTSNCAATPSSATMQKKAVSGPFVSLMVNPLECDLLIEKTCCVTQPALPDLGMCEGDMVNLVLEYTGDKCHNSNNDQGRAFRCHGKRSPDEPVDILSLDDGGILSVTPASGVNKGDTVTVTSSTGVLNEWLKLETTGPWSQRQLIKLDTSCERAIGCGDQFGAYEVVGFESTLGGVVDCSAPPPPVCAAPGDPVGTPCDAKLIDMVLEYNGQACQSPLPNPQSGGATCSGDATGATDVGVIYTGPFANRQMESPASNINDGDRIRVTATERNGLFPNQSFKIVDDSGVLQTVGFHVSCSQPLALGDEFGSFELVEFTTKNGTTAALGAAGNGQLDACEVPLAPPGPHCTSALQELTLVYIGDFLGQGCSVSNPQGGFGTCSGVDDPGDPVSVVAGVGTNADPEDTIEFGDLVTISPSSGSELPAFVNVDVTGAGGTQSIQIKASCDKPLSLGDRFGSFVVFGMSRDEEGPITLGGNVQYQYKVTNPNDGTADNVVIDDDQLGEIVSGLSLAPGEMQTFVQNATLFGTTTNVATASGDVCEAGVDQVTVTVTAPPAGSFGCSGPISELTMVWDGASAVQVDAWAGEPGASAFLGHFPVVNPGDEITVTGMGADVPVWEILTTGGTNIGESSFDLWCNDSSMNGIEDCGKRNGNLQDDAPGLTNDWLLEGMVDTDESIQCTPELVAPPPSGCGLGIELALALPGLMLLHRRRMKRAP